MTGRQLQRPSSIGTPIRPSAPATADLQKDKTNFKKIFGEHVKQNENEKHLV